MAAPKDNDKSDKSQKRQRNGPGNAERDDITYNILNQFKGKKKVKVNSSTEFAEMREKILEFDNKKQQEWKKLSDNIFKNISEIKSQVEVDYNNVKEIGQNLEKVTAAFMKCIKEATVAFEQILQALHDLNKIKKQYEDKLPEEKEAIEQLISELNSYIQDLTNNINKEAKRKSLDSMCTLLHKLQEEEE